MPKGDQPPADQPKDDQILEIPGAPKPNPAGGNDKPADKDRPAGKEKPGKEEEKGKGGSHPEGQDPPGFTFLLTYEDMQPQTKGFEGVLHMLLEFFKMCVEATPPSGAISSLVADILGE